MSTSGIGMDAFRGPGRHDVLKTLEFFFGDPVSPEKLKDYTEHHAQTYHFPDAYTGLNTKLRETMNNLILRSPQTWQTAACLPFVQIEGTVVEWDEIHFDVRLMQRVPYEGVSRMQTSLKRRHRDRVVRRGLGMMIESDFYATDAGRKHFADQLTSIRYCVQETCNFDVLFSLLTCGNYDFRYDLAKGLRPRSVVKTAMAHDLMMFAITQKDGLGMDRAIEEAKFRMSRYSVTPDMLIVPPQLSLYLSTAPNEKTLFVDGGSKAVAEFESGRAGFETRAYRSLGVVSSEPFEISDESNPVQMLTRSTQVGEFYIMRPPPFPPKKGTRPGFLDILVYDEESDRHIRVSWADALKATCAEFLITQNDASAVSYGNYTMNKANGDPYKFTDWFDEAVALDKLNVTSVPEDDVGYLAFVGAYNTYLECMMVVTRPFIEHLMHSAVVMKAGRETGATLFGPADMQISSNTQVKTIEGHYTGHFKSVVTNPQNVFIMRDIACAGYVAGGNCDFFYKHGSGKGRGTVGSDDILKDMREGFTKRLDADTNGEKMGSMFAFPLSPQLWEEGKMDTCLSMSNRVLPWDTQGGGFSTFPSGETLGNMYNDKFGLYSIHHGEDQRGKENHDYTTQGSHNNSLCFLGPHRVYAVLSSKGDQMELVPGQGHFGPDAVPGDARWRRGEVVSLKASRETITHATDGYKFAFA